MEIVDVAIVGGGPAGSTCAAFCAKAGLRTLVIEREKFPREQVCGDGRNSTVARLRNLLPRPERERVALQAHIPLPQNFGNRVVLQFLPEGYSGQAPVNDRELNLCLVGTPPTISSLRTWAEKSFDLA